MEHKALIQYWMVVAAFLCKATLAVNEDKSTDETLNFYSFPVMDITGNIISLEEYSGKVSLVVNVASQCGYTDGHYKMLNLLQKLFGDSGKFNVLAFPCNQFGGQEPGSPQDIVDFAYNKMGATFPLFAKVDVVDHSVNQAWDYLIKESGLSPTWNFWKYLVDHSGHVINAWGPSVSPDQLYPNIQAAIDKAVSADPQQPRGEENSTDDGKRTKDEF